MSKKRRSKSITNPNDMSTDNYAEDSACTDTEATLVEPAVEAAAEPVTLVEPAVEAVAEPVTLVEPAVEAVAEPVAFAESADKYAPIDQTSTITVPADVLFGVFTKRIVDSIDSALWAKAVTAVKQGRTVVLRGYAPHIEVTEDSFDPEGKLPAGVSSPASVLNNLLAGMF